MHKMKSTTRRQSVGDFFVLRSTLIRSDIFNYHDARELCLSLYRGDCANPSGIQELFDRAILISSPSFASRLFNIRTGMKPSLASDKNVDKMLITIFKFLNRMMYRATPFGLFSAVSVGEIDEASNLRLHDVQLDIFPSGSLVNAVKEKIEQVLLETGELRIVANPTIYSAGNEFRFLALNDTGYAANRSIYKTQDITEILQYARSPTSILDVVSATKSQLYRETKGIIASLFSSGALLSDLSPPLAAKDGIKWIVEHVKSLNSEVAALNMTSILVQLGLRQYCDGDLENGEKLQKFHFEKHSFLNQNHSDKGSWHVDTYASGPCKLARSIIDRTLSAVGVVLRLTYRPNPYLTQIKLLFSEKYSFSSIPLLHVLDKDYGIGRQVEELLSTNLDQVDNSLFQKQLLQLMSTQRDAWAEGLNLNDIPLIEKSGSKALEKYCGSAIFSLCDNDQKAERIFLKGIFLGSGNEMLARFALDHPMLTRKLIERSNSKFVDDNQTFKFAEILPLINVQYRDIHIKPRLLKHSISLGSYSGYEEGQIACQDILVEHDGNNVYLRDRRDGKVIFPELNSAHAWGAPSNILIYRVLNLFSKAAMGGFHWPSNFLHLDHRPRIVANDVWIAPAEWNIPGEKRKEILRGSIAEKVSRLRSYLKGARVPDVFEYGADDRFLKIDSNNDFQLESMLNLMANSKCLLRESFESVSKSSVFDTHGHPHNNEIVVPFGNPLEGKNTTSTFRLNKLNASDQELPNILANHRDWVYYKIYGAHKAINKLLETNFIDLITALKGQKYISDWFFIQYADPDYHLRLRMRPAFELRQEIINTFSKFLDAHLVKGRIIKWELSTYEPEVNRYGGDESFLNIQAIFDLDSEYAISVRRLSKAILPCDREKFCLIALALNIKLISEAAFGRLEPARAFLVDLCAQYIGSQEVRKDLLSKYEGMYSEIFTGRAISEHPFPGYHELGKLLDATSFSTNLRLNTIRRLAEEDRLTTNIHNIIGSVIHMSSNRLIKRWNRTKEYVAIDLARRISDREVNLDKKRLPDSI